MPFVGALNVPMGENTALGIGKESTPGVAVVPSIWHAHLGFTPGSKNTPIARQGARKKKGQTYPGTGTYELKISLSVESDPDTVGQLIAFGLGNQSAPVTGATFALTTITSSPAMGATTFTVADPLQLVVGEKITVGTATAVAISSISYSTNTVTVGSGLSSAQTTGASVFLSGTTAFGSTMKLTNGTTPLPSFSIQVNRVTDAVVYYGCKVSGMNFTMDQKGGLLAKFTIEAMDAAVVGSPATPSFSTKYPFLFNNPNSQFMFNGAQAGVSGEVAVLDWAIDVNNALLDSYYSFGNGRFKMAIPEQQVAVSGKVTLGFETNAAQARFWGGSNGPANVIPGTAIEAFIASTDLADPGANAIPYSIAFIVGNAFITQGEPDVKPNGALTQPIVFSGAETGNGALDDLLVSLVNTASTAY